MRPSGFELWRLSIPLKGGFAHAASSRTTSELALVAVHDAEGRVGWGEALPRTYVTGEDLDTLLATDAPALARKWLDREIEGMDALAEMLRSEVPRERYGLSCFGAFELALLDLAGQCFDRSVADVLGGIQRLPLPAGIVIGFEVPTAKLERHCGVLRYGKRRHIKLKVGAEDDVARMEICARVFGDLKIRIDANAAWSADEAMRRLESLARFPIASVEQPVASDDLATMRRIREELGLAVMADESVCTAADAVRVADAGAADVLNVRVGKMGGVLATLAICELSRSRGIATSLGTMVGETGVLSVASEVFGRCVPGFDYLDGKGQNAFLLAEDILEPDSPDTGPTSGLGVRVSRDRVRKYANADPTRIGRV
jgi:L-alanine-DL-glutamate epimerase-like enolase superfamily enzyme